MIDMSPRYFIIRFNSRLSWGEKALCEYEQMTVCLRRFEMFIKSSSKASIERNEHEHIFFRRLVRTCRIQHFIGKPRRLLSTTRRHPTIETDLHTLRSMHKINTTENHLHLTRERARECETCRRTQWCCFHRMQSASGCAFIAIKRTSIFMCRRACKSDTECQKNEMQKPDRISSMPFPVC